MKAFSHFPSFSCFWSESRSLKLLQVASCKFNKKRLSVIGSPFAEQSFRTYQVLCMMILSPPLREKGHNMAEDVCFKEEHGEHEMRREDEKQERVLVFS